MKITHGSMYHNTDLETMRVQVMTLRALRFGVQVKPTYVIDFDHPVRARIYNNMIIADCPDCNGAEIIFIETPLFMCNSCWNNKYENKWRPVILPKDLDKICAVLERRPMPHNRNWFPHETLEDLIKENELHKAEIF